MEGFMTCLRGGWPQRRDRMAVVLKNPSCRRSQTAVFSKNPIHPGKFVRQVEFDPVKFCRLEQQMRYRKYGSKIALSTHQI
jgi:hypothetical protein